MSSIAQYGAKLWAQVPSASGYQYFKFIIIDNVILENGHRKHNENVYSFSTNSQ